jgi:hypothetical protein
MKIKNILEKKENIVGENILPVNIEFIGKFISETYISQYCQIESEIKFDNESDNYDIKSVTYLKKIIHRKNKNSKKIDNNTHYKYQYNRKQYYKYKNVSSPPCTGISKGFKYVED